MADLQPNESRLPFQEVPRCYVHVHELDVLIRKLRSVLHHAEWLKESSLRSDRLVEIPCKYTGTQMRVKTGPPLENEPAPIPDSEPL